MTVNAAFRAALQQLREHFSSLGDQSPVQSISLDEGGVAFAVRSGTGEVVANINICWTEADNYPNSGCLFFGHDAVSGLSERFQDRGELGEVIAQVLRTVLGRDFDVPRATGAGAPVAMEEDSAGSKEGGGDVGMEEGSEAEWDDVPSGNDENDDYGGDDDDDGQDEQESDEEEHEEEDEEERELIIMCSMNLGRWERHEAVVEAAAAEAAGKQALSTTQGLAAKRQIFAPREAFALLSRELLDFLRARHVDCSVETGGDDIYHWIVDLGSFAEGGALSKDMREVSRRYFYSTVRLRLRFMRGLHPFFPPSVEVVWPHLAGPLLGAVASHPMLRLENWDPWRPAMETVAQIKAFLEAHARVDLDNPANDIRLHPASTYSPLERGLARLEALSGMQPSCLADPAVAQLYSARDSFDKDAARLQALSEGGKKRSRTEPATTAAKPSREVVWARGTGYGSGSNSKTGELWDAKATEAAQRARDTEIQSVLDEMSYSLRRELGPLTMTDEDIVSGTGADAVRGGAASASTAGQAADAADGPAAMEGVETTAAAASGLGAGADAGAGSSEDDTEPRLGAAGCVAAIQSSCLLPFLVRELQLSSFADVGARHKYFTALLTLVQELCRPGAHDLLWVQTPGQEGRAGGAAGGGATGPSVASILTSGLRSAARMYLNVLGPATAQAAAAPSTSAPATRVPDKAALAAEQATKEAEGTQQLARIILRVANFLQTHPPLPQQQQPQQQGVAAGASAPGADSAAPASCTCGAQQKQQGQQQQHPGSGAAAVTERVASGAQASSSSSGAGGSSSPSSSAVYMATLKPLQMDAVSSLGRGHHYANTARQEQHVPRTRAVRLAKEIASLESLLPLSESSSIFVRVDETAVQMWKAIVIGPEDTPYSGGCFVFDLYFPPQYPGVAPQVHLLTTGGGRVRFNPNLYAEGKVCLSLLGTWSGDRGESWNPDVSTAVQVLVSIQSLILVPEPYYNEPSYETQTGDSTKRQSREYSKAVRENCVRYAMLDVLRHPPAAFAKVISQHFRLRRDYLLAQIKTWADEARESGDAGAASRLMEMRREMEGLVAAAAIEANSEATA